MAARGDCKRQAERWHQMGIYNSSVTRVRPVFGELKRRNDDWVRRLVALPSFGHPSSLVDSNLDLAVRQIMFDPQERALQPPKSLLRWLVQNVEDWSGHALTQSGSARDLRQRLIRRDPEAIAKALSLLDRGPPKEGWLILEGASYPDVFIETEDALIVIEGKRTEPGPTTSTTWMPIRHQMLRHIDDAWEVRGDKKQLYGFFIVEGEPDDMDIPPNWVAAAKACITEEALNGSLPHRSPSERTAIAKCFLGVTTWQAVCHHFDIPWNELPTTVAAAELT